MASRLVLALCVAAPLVWPGAVDAQSGSGTTLAQNPAVDSRPFEHARHRSVECAVCHSRDQRHSGRQSWTPRDCAACHHGDARPAGCTTCHDRTDLMAPRQPAVPMALSVWDEVRVRELSFEHGRHDQVGCLDCHEGGMRLPPRSCDACHADHHRAAANCAGCHGAPDPGIHGREVHASCAGGGCHEMAGSEPIERARPACLLCHEEMQEHKAGRACVACHVLPQTTSRESQ